MPTQVSNYHIIQPHGYKKMQLRDAALKGYYTEDRGILFKKCLKSSADFRCCKKCAQLEYGKSDAFMRLLDSSIKM